MKALALALILTLTGCSALGAGALKSLLLPAASNGVSADAEVTIGKKEEGDINTQVGDSSTQAADTITNVAEGMDFKTLLLLCLMAGWAIPDPQTMGRGIITFLKTLLPWGSRDGR